jgi:hypothetical protein
VVTVSTKDDLLEQVALDLDYLCRQVSAALADLGHLEGIRLIDKVRIELTAAYEAVNAAGNVQRALADK